MSLILKKETFKNNTSKHNSFMNTTLVRQAHNKSLVDPTGGIIFQLSQPQIHFLNTEVNQTYEISMNVRNVSEKKQQIRLKKPKSANLTVTLTKEGIIAPGLDTKIIVTYDSKENQRLQDFFTIISDKFQCEVPIHVIPEAGKLQFEPFINFGFIKVGSGKEIVWKIKNQSDTLTSIQLNHASASFYELTIEPNKLVLEPRIQREIKLKIASHEAGHVEGVIDIEPKLFSVSSIDFVANFCEYARFISDDQGNHLSEIVIDPLFAGESAQIQANIVNNTPQSCEFRISRKKGAHNQDQNNLITPQEFGKDDSQKLINFTPLEGTLEPYQSVSLLTKVQANFTEPDQQLFCNYILGRIHSVNEEKQFSYTVKVHINEEENPLVLYLKGTSMIPKLGLSSTYFDFGDHPVNSKKQAELKIQNFSSKPVKIVFKNALNFTFSHKIVKIDTKSSLTVIVTFIPKIVDYIHEISPLIVGQFSFPIKLLGKGIFNLKKKKKSNSGLQNYDSIKGQEMKLQEMNNTFLQNEISYIKGDDHAHRKSPIRALDEANRTTVRFDQSYIGQVDQSMSVNSISLTHHKKSKTLRDRSGKQIKISQSTQMNPHQQIAPYPSIPKNQQEQRTINKQLTSIELTNIQVGQVMIDLGKVYLKSMVKRVFHIFNFNAKPISVQLNTNNLECFSESYEEKQIFPANSMGGVMIKFQALKEGDFKYNIQYVINGKHFFEIMLTGLVIQPTLNVSRNQIKFFATDEDRGFLKKENFILTNPFDYEVQFSVSNAQQTPNFKVEPQSGKIFGNGSKTLTIIHRFDKVQQIGVKIEQIVKIKITHGKVLQIKCLSLVPECNCVSKSTEINFKEVAIGKIYENKIVIKNMSKNFTIYKVLIPQQIENLVSASPNDGFLLSEGMQQIVFKIQGFSSMNIDENISFLIRGGKPLTLPVRASIIIPKVKIQNTKIDFGSTPTEGNPSARAITLVNDSQIPVDLQFRLPYDSFLCQSLKINKILDENSQIISTELPSNPLCKSYVLRINPKARSNVILEFTPQSVMSYEFLLPLFILNSNQSITELQRPCTCKGIKNRLLATQKEINFGKIIIEQNLESYQKNRMLQIKNPQQEPIQWWIDDSNIYPFSLQKSRGKLQGFEKVNLKVFFYSDIEGQYTKELQFFINQNEKSETLSKQSDSNQEYLKITVKASACFPTLYFDQPYVIMPVVGLNQESKSTFQIINGGYENINIKYIIVQEFSNVDIKVNFLVGTNLGVTKKKIKVEVSFKSDKPISFTVKLNFYDANNRVFSLPISGTSDNCIYTIIQDERYLNSIQQEIQKDCNFLKYYINSIGCLDDSLYQFPRSMAENQYEKFIQFLCYFSSSFDKTKLNVKKNDKNKKFFFNFDFLSQIIRAIKGQGGFLNQIRPEFLLQTYQQYHEAIKLRADNNSTVLANYSLLNEEAFNLEHKKSWVILTYQTFKVYSKVSVGKTKGNEFWSKFSTKEKIIVNWLQQAYVSEAKIQYQKKRHVLQEMNDSQLLSAVISKYTNIKVLEFYGRQIKGLKEKERRIQNIIETFSQIGINCHCRVEDILRSNPKEMLLILEGLYLILPSYLQKGDPITFSCALGQTITKSIQISNPSKHQITYVAKIDSSNRAYVIENEQEFTLQSKATHQIKIKYISNVNINNSSARLTLTGKTSSKFTPSTFIFVLKSQNLGRVSEKNIQITGQLYEQYEFGINVQNNFDTEGQFRIEILNANSNKENPLSFYCLNSVVKIRKGEITTLNILFIPLILETQKCFIIFRDPKVGEFQYEVTGLVEGPQLSLDVLKVPQTLLTNKKYSINLNIPAKNDNLVKARKIIESIFQRTEKKVTKTQQNFVTVDKYFPKVNLNETYSVKIIPPNEMVHLRADTFVIKEFDEKVVQPNQQQQVNKQEPKVQLQINMKIAIKEGSFILVIKNNSNTDIRRYKVLLNSVYKPLKYELQMKTPVNKTLVQNLPLININNEVNTFSLTLIANQISKGIFSIQRQREVIVAAKTTENVVLNFKPKSQVTYNASIKMENVTTGQIVEYQVTGIGEEPDLQTLTFEQEIRKQKTHQIKIPLQRTAKCVITKFTLQDAVYEKSFIINNSNNNSFKFKYNPKIPGTFESKLIIEDDLKVYAYKIVINVKDVVEQEISFRTIQRKIYQGEITNIPQGSYEVFSVNTSLRFEKVFVSDNQNKGVFKFEYYSTKPGNSECYLVLKSEKIGQLTYLLKVSVQQMPEFKFQAFTVELGSRHEELIKFQNHEETPMKVTGKCTQPKIFYFEPSNIVVQPHSSLTAKLIYFPSKLEMQEGKVNFLSDRGEKWNYHMSGYGMIQSKPQIIQMRSQVGTQRMESVSFINPLQKRVQVTVQLVAGEGDKQNSQQSQRSFKDQGQVFGLLIKNNRFELDYGQELILPIVLKPKTITVYKALLLLSVGDKITFKYELQCVAEYFYSQEKSLKIPAKIKKDEVITFELPFVNKNQIELLSKAKLKITTSNQSLKGLLKDAVKVIPKQQNLIENNKISFDLSLKANKPFKVTTNFIVTIPNGCKWIQKYDIIFTAPSVEDKIEIVSEINKAASTRFKLANRTKNYAKFKAYFAQSSSGELTITPKFGELEPAGRQGTAFEITFLPTAYKKQWQGKLIIETDDSYWSYDVKGTLPPYLPPIAKSLIASSSTGKLPPLGLGERTRSMKRFG